MSTFDQAFQEQLAAHFMRDDKFVSAVGSLVKPEYFEDETLAALVSVMGDYINKYLAPCTLKTFVQILNASIASKRVKIADQNEMKRLIGVIYKDPLKDRQYVIDTISEFARHQSLLNATLTMADALELGKADKITEALLEVENAKNVGAVDSAQAHDFKHDRATRLQQRKNRLNGGTSVRGISTGFPDLDKHLTPWGGWGRKELSILMGPPKSGKTAALVTFGVNAAREGFNVFYASCEVSEEILGERADANISGIPMKSLVARESELEQALDDFEASPLTGSFVVQSFPIRTLKVSALKRLLKKMESQGKTFDLIIVDYGDILKPETIYSDKRHGFAEIFQDLRALATEFNAAVLTATQTNREGTKKAARNVTDGTDAAEDYEKVRTADALITINASPQDRANGEVVLYFSEMRNAESGLRIRFSQDISCMRFLLEFLGVET